MPDKTFQGEITNESVREACYNRCHTLTERVQSYTMSTLEKYRKEHGAWNKGEHLTPTQYEKISRERKERCSKAITAYNPITHEAVLHFDSCTEASKHLGVSKSCIARCAKGGRKTSAGYIWRYDNDNI